MEKIKKILALSAIVLSFSVLMTGCWLFGGKDNDESSVPTYNISFISCLDHGEMVNPNDVYYKNNERVELLPASCEGYVFDGWYLGVTWTSNWQPDYSNATQIEAIEIGTNRDLMIYARWHKGEFTITFDAGEGSFEGEVKTKTLSFEFEQEIDLSAFSNPSRNGYDFYEWPDVPQQMPAQNLTTNAVWSKRYAVSYVLNTDESLQTSEITWTWANNEENPVEYSKASDISLKSATTTRPGYAFDGWYLDAELQRGVGNLKNVPDGSEEITLYAKWSLIFNSFDPGTINNLKALGRRQKEINLPNKYIDDEGNVKTITRIGGGGSSIFSATIGYTPSQVEKVTICEGITYIATRSFQDANVLKEVVLPSTITSFGDYAFSECSNLTNINIEDTFGSLTNIGASAFQGSPISFERIEFPENIKTIGSCAFLGIGIKEIEIYSNTNVGGSTFAYNFVLEKVTVKQAETQAAGSVWVDANAFIFSFDDDAVGNFEVIFDSVYAYASSNATAMGGMGGGNYYGYIRFAKTVKVKKDFVDNVIKAQEDRNNTNTFLNDEEKFTKTENGDYYAYERIITTQGD